MTAIERITAFKEYDSIIEKDGKVIAQQGNTFDTFAVFGNVVVHVNTATRIDGKDELVFTYVPNTNGKSLITELSRYCKSQQDDVYKYEHLSGFARFTGKEHGYMFYFVTDSDKGATLVRKINGSHLDVTEINETI